MKTSFLLLLATFACSFQGQAQSSPTETQAVVRQLNQLMRDPKKPKQDVTLTIKGCHAEQLIRDRDADVNTSSPLAMSFNNGDSGWAVKMDNGVFEMKMSFDWADVTALTYEPETDKDGTKHYQIKIKKSKKGSNISFDLPLYTTDLAVVKDITARLDKVRRGCKG
ncbi:MAG TPA: hypothetical protein VF629_19025 [Hymenobacter sp.]|jgi:hypothetical protein|uniref:hypothetical protein n=1 Tax=Hymenobacter sp. TaxID=1898978 RepID=UPI002EDB8C38